MTMSLGMKKIMICKDDVFVNFELFPIINHINITSTGEG
jgi:hypothetical protein